MSFILDALRKSEHDRQRQAGPALAEVAAAPARPKTNVWASAAVALLLINLIGVGILLLRRAHQGAPAQPSTAATAGEAAVAPPPQAPPVQTPVLVPAPAVQTPRRQSPPPAVASEPGSNPLEQEVSAHPGMDDSMAAQASAVPEGPPAVSRVPAAHRGSVVYESAPQAAGAPAAASASRREPQTANLPTADELVAGGAVPALHLDLHVYSARVAERFVFVNSHKYREGDTLAEGPLVEQITPTGAVLSYRGGRFLLPNN